MGIDPHALSALACASELQVLAANGVEVMLAMDDQFTPTPAISHAIVKHNPAHGGPAGQDATDAIQRPLTNFSSEACKACSTCRMHRSCRPPPCITMAFSAATSMNSIR
jgi:phosphoglucomutase